MNTKKFRTLVGRGANSYIKGRISGMMEIICGDPGRVPYAIMPTKYGDVLTTRCTIEQYAEFMIVVEKHYPNVCIFNYEP